MKSKNSVEQRIASVANAVKLIEETRSNLFVKMLPSLYADEYARTIFNKPLVWSVITIDKEFLRKIERVFLDNLADLGGHLKFYDATDVELLPIPPDIIALMTMNTGQSDVSKEIIENEKVPVEI